MFLTFLAKANDDMKVFKTLSAKLQRTRDREEDETDIKCELKKYPLRPLAENECKLSHQCFNLVDLC